MTVAELRDLLVNYLSSQGVLNVSGIYRTAVELKDLAEPQVSVVPSGVEVNPASRASTRRDISIDIAYRVVAQRDATEELDPHSAAVESIAGMVPAGTVISSGAPAILSASRSPLWSSEHLETHNVFTSVIKVVFLVIESNG